MHHIVSDGWSMAIFFRELSVLYEAYSNHQKSPLPELPIQYADYAVWQRHWLKGDVLEAQMSYWNKQLQDLPATGSFPADRPQPAVRRHRGKKETFELSKSVTGGLKALSRSEGVTLFITLLAAFQTLLYRYTGRKNIVVGSPIANRSRTETEGLIGFFVNTLVLRSDLSGNPTFRELLTRVREVCLGAYTYQELPYQKLVATINSKRDPNRGSLAQALFAFQNIPRSPLKIPGLTVTPIRTDLGIAKAPLTLFMWEADKCLAGSFHYDADLFNAATISQIVEHLQSLLTAVVGDPEQRLLDLVPLLEQSRSELLQAMHWALERSPHYEIDATDGREEGEL
jgi:non-ribosomal peptide synthetase component F